MKSAFRLFATVATALFACAALRAQSNYATPYSFTTLAGAAKISGSVDGPGGSARFSRPWGIVRDRAGNLFVADRENRLIRKITPSGVVTTFAGSTIRTSTNAEDGTGSAARFKGPAGLAIDAADNLYVGDDLNSSIRKITPSGVVTTLAGGGGGSGSKDGTGRAAEFSGPVGLAVDRTGNIYVADEFNRTIRKITSGGVVTTLAGKAGTTGDVDGSGSGARFSFPRGVAVDISGNVYVADTGNNKIRKITSAGVVTTLAGLTDLSGGTDGPSNVARFSTPMGLTVDAAGNVFVADSFAGTIRKITSDGVVATLAGKYPSTSFADGTGADVRFFNPVGIAVDSDGKLYVAESVNNTIRVGVPTISPAEAIQVITFAALANKTTGDAPFALNASASSGLSVTFSVVSGPATLSGSTLTLTGAGTVLVRASQAGNTAYTAATPVDRSFTVTLSPVPLLTSSTAATGSVGQSFSYTATFSGSPTSLTATGLPGGLSFAAATGVISGTPTTAGTYAIALRATNSAGTGTATLTLSVAANTAKTDQTITFAALPNRTVGDAPSVLSASASSGLAVTFSVVSGPATLSGSTLTLTGAGIVVVRAMQVGSSTYNAATSVERSFTVTATPTTPVTPTPAVANYAPPALSGDAVIGYSGTTVDSFDGSSASSSTFRTTSSTAFQGGTYTYTRTGPTTARLSYTLVSTFGNDSETEIGAVSLVFTSATRGTYTSSGTYTGVYQGRSYSGSFTGMGSFTYTPPAGIPTVTTQPSSQVVAPGGSVTLAVVAAAATGYQWQKDGINLDGKVNSSLTLANLQAADSGAYVALISNANGSILSDTITLTVGSATTPKDPVTPAAPGSRLSNLSVLTTLATNQLLTVGFTMDGGSREVLVRAVGPGLAGFGLTGTMVDPGITLFKDSVPVAINDDWSADTAFSKTTASVTAAVGAFALTSGSYDAALVRAISGGHTVQVGGYLGGAGKVIVEVYDVGTGSSPRLTNISALNQVGTGSNILVAGFSVAGTGAKSLLIRAVGPGLTAFGVGGVLLDPKLEVYDSAQVKIAENDNWAATLAPTFTSVGSFGLTAGSKDAALVVTGLSPGGYTVQVSGVNATTGRALVEIYELP